MAKKHMKRCLMSLVSRKMQIKTTMRHFPGGPVVSNLPSNAGDVGSIPGWGTKIPHAVRQLRLHAVTNEPVRHN